MAAAFGFVAAVASPVRAKAEAEEVRVCTHRTCRRQGSIETLETLSSLAPPHFKVTSCGCLGRCGAGPNLAFLPQGVLVGHCGTAARAAEVLFHFCGASADADASKLSLEALALRKRAEAEIDQGNFSQADLLLSQAIDLRPCGGIHIIYKVRSLARLAMEDYSGALKDASESLTFAPNYPEAYICQGDAFIEMNQHDEAEKSYLACLEIDPSIRRTKSFKARIAKLQEKLTAANIP